MSSAAAFSDRGVATEVDSRGNVGLVEYWKPLMWSAIFGGMVAAMGVQVILTLLGVGLGAAMANPASEPWADNDARGMGIGAVVWLILSGIISFGIGGYVAGCMSGVIRTGSGALHGMLAWALAAVVGTTVTALAGSATLGGAAAGAGAGAGGMAGTMRAPYIAMGSGTPREPVSATDGRTDGAARQGTVSPDGNTPRVSEADARIAAEKAAKGVARVSLWTGLAFVLSMLAATAGGVAGRKAPFKAMSQNRGAVRPATA